MLESVIKPLTGTKQERYEALIGQCRALTEGETDWIANAANIVAAVHREMGFLWTGVYRVVGDMLVLGPFQGPVACTRIRYGKGVCGTSWERNEGLLVPDVEQFPGHIRCSSAARSEVVVPIHSDGAVVGVLDIDSAELGGLDECDLRALTDIAALIRGN